MRSPLFESVIARFQRFAGELIDIEGPEDLAAALSRLCHDTPAPTNKLEHIVISNLLMRALVAASTFLHPLSGSRTCSCPRVVVDTVMMLLGPAPTDPRQVFLEWIDRYFQVYERNHLASPAALVAKLIRASPARAWHVSELARLQNVKPKQLLRQFTLEHGISLRDYVHLVRLKRAIAAIVGGTDKIEVIALEVGYRSKKDFYRTVWTWLKTTPAQIRRLSAAEQSRLVDSVHEAYARTFQRRFSTAVRPVPAKAGLRDARREVTPSGAHRSPGSS